VTDDATKAEGSGSPTSAGRGSLEERALAQLRANVRTGYDPYYRHHYSYVRPSPGRYTWQWLWDSCFHAVALARLDSEMAKQELRNLLAAQTSDGFFGHVIYWGRMGCLRAALFGQSPPALWGRRQSGMLQPPVLAQAIEAVYEATGDSAFLSEILPKAQAYYDWLSRHRDPDGGGLIVILSPFEAGVDNSPAYDEALGLSNPSRARALWVTRGLDLRNIAAGRLPAATRGPFALLDVLVNSVYADGLRTLAGLWTAAGDGERATEASHRADRAEAALHERCWNGQRGVYAHRWLKQDGEERLLTPLTISSIFPLILDSTPPDRLDALVERHLRNEDEFWVAYPVPSAARSEPSFDPSGEALIWRGPANMGLNWLLVRGLRRRGLDDEANHIADRSREMAERSGFREFYDPLTGRGLRGTNFGWATAVVAMEA